MAKKIQRLFGLVLLLLTNTVWAQDPKTAYTAFEMRSNGKIYVVVTVLLIILIGLFLYLIRLDRKITRLEKENK